MTEYGRSPERSIVTMVAFDTVGSTRQISGLDPDDAQVFLDRILDYIKRKIEASGGFVASFHGDGGFGIFGWPRSLENHADLACEAAWAIQHPAEPKEVPVSPDGKPVEFRVGIHTGLVGFRQLETGVGTSLDIVGAHVHLAATLQKAAPPGGIVISSGTVSMCRNALSLDEYQSVDGKHTDGAPYFLLTAPPNLPNPDDPAAQYPMPIVGREKERREINAALTPAPARPTSAAIIGEPGIGKSRLAYSVLADWRAEKRVILSFSGDSRRQTTPFTMIKSLILSALNLPADTMEPQIVEALSVAGIPQTHIAELGASVFRLRDAPKPKVPVQTARQVATRLVQTLSALTKDKHPHLLIEDVHLIDPESLDCLAMIASGRECQHMVTLMTGRPEAGGVLSRIARTVLHLEPMRAQEMVAMAKMLSGHEGVSKELLEHALKQSEGVPFVLEQLLVSSRLQSDAADSMIPQSVESLIHGRLNTLSRRAKSIVQSISVLGNDVELEVALKILDMDIDALQPHINELSRFGLLRGDVGRYLRFQHSIIASACLNTVPKLKRRSIHQAAVEAIISVHPQSDSQYERLAFHAEGAGDADMALDYLWLAGLQARRSAAAASLLTIFRRAMDCIEKAGDTSSERHVDFFNLSCAALLQIGEFEEMKSAVPKAISIARKLDNPDKLCATLGQLGTIEWFEGDYRSAYQTCTEALALAENLNSQPLVFAAQIMKASVLHGMGKLEEAVALQRALCNRLRDDLETARLGAAAVPSSMAHAFLGWFLVEIGENEDALKHSDQALKIAERHRDPYAEVLARNAQGRVLLQQNRAREAMRTMLTAKRICDSEGFDAINPHVTGRLASALSRSGSTEMAVKTAGEFVKKTNASRTGYLETFNLRLGYGESLCRNGQMDDGLEEIGMALQMAVKISSPCLKLQALSVRAAVLNGVGDNSDLAEKDHTEIGRLCKVYGLSAWIPEGIAENERVQ